MEVLTDQGQSHCLSIGGRQRSIGRRMRGSISSTSGQALEDELQKQSEEQRLREEQQRLQKLEEDTAAIHKKRLEDELDAIRKVEEALEDELQKQSEEQRRREEQQRLQKLEEYTAAIHKKRLEDELDAIRKVEEALSPQSKIITDWVDQVADDIFLDAMHDQALVGFDESGDLWENISAASVEDLDHADVIDISQYLIDDGTLEVQQEEPPQQQHLQHEKVAIASPSRSSTPSRSVRNRRRVIGAVRPMTPTMSQEAMWDSAASCQFKVATQAQLGAIQINTGMKRQASAPAIALDLSTEPCPPAPGFGSRYTPSKSSMSALAMDLGGDAVPGRQTPMRSFGATSDPVVCKSKSMSALYTTSSSYGLGLPLLAPSPKLGGKGVLPVLSDCEKTRKSELIAWSMNMAKNKRGGLRSVF